jgi:hypothetical protein
MYLPSSYDSKPKSQHVLILKLEVKFGYTD